MRGNKANTNFMKLEERLTWWDVCLNAIRSKRIESANVFMLATVNTKRDRTGKQLFWCRNHLLRNDAGTV